MSPAALSRAITIFLLIVGVPLILGVYRLFDRTNPLLCYVLLGLLLVATVLQSGNTPFVGRRERPYWLLFVVLLAATLPAVLVDRGSLRDQMLGLVTCFIWTSVAVSLASNIRTAADLRRAVRAFDVLGVLMVGSVLFGALASKALGIEFGETVTLYGLFRVFGPLGDQVAFAIVPVTVGAVLRGRLVLSVACVAALLLTGTRGALVALAIAALWALVTARQWYPYLPRRERRRVRLMAAAVAVGWCFVMFGMSGVVGAFLNQQINNTSRSSYAVRNGPFILGVEVASVNPVLGVGYLGFRTHALTRASSARFNFGSDVERATYTTQNQLVQTATDAGIPGVLALVWFVVSTLRCFAETRRAVAPASRLRIVALEAGFVGLAVGNQSAVWVLPTAAAGYVVFILSALAWRSREILPDAAPVASASHPQPSTTVG